MQDLYSAKVALPPPTLEQSDEVTASCWAFTYEQIFFGQLSEALCNRSAQVM